MSSDSPEIGSIGLWSGTISFMFKAFESAEQMSYTGGGADSSACISHGGEEIFVPRPRSCPYSPLTYIRHGQQNVHSDRWDKLERRGMKGTDSNNETSRRMVGTTSDSLAHTLSVECTSLMWSLVGGRCVG